jgi:3-oxoacyl-[acyl-carrier protein] reductase
MSIDQRMDLQGKVVVVAGAGGGGIGTAIAAMLAEAGAAVAALDVRKEALDAVDAAMPGGASHLNIVTDVRDPQSVNQAIADAATLGPLHGLVHVAGGLFGPQWSPLLDLDPSTFDEVMDLNLRSVLLTTQATARKLVEQGTGGSIVTIASIAGLTAMPYGVPYAASKAGMVGFMRTAAVEWGQYGIRVNAVAPGTIATPKSRIGRPEGMPDETPEVTATLPLGRRGQPDDIAGAVLFLQSGLSSYVTGQVIAVDGGSSTKPSFLDGDNIPVAVQDPAMRQRLLGR